MKNKKITSVVAVILTVVIVSIVIGLFGGCTYRGDFFDNEHLQLHLVDNLPKPQNKIVEDRGSYAYVSMTKEEFEQYVVSVYDYLLSCNFERFGTRGEVLSGLIGMQYYADTNVSQLGDFYIKQTYADGDYSYSYIFVWANEMGKLYQSSQSETWLSHYMELKYEDSAKQMYMEMCLMLNPHIFAE